MQIVSSSVADALEFCRDGLQLEQFQSCQGTESLTSDQLMASLTS